MDPRNSTPIIGPNLRVVELFSEYGGRRAKDAIGNIVPEILGRQRSI